MSLSKSFGKVFAGKKDKVTIKSHIHWTAHATFWLCTVYKCLNWLAPRRIWLTTAYTGLICAQYASEVRDTHKLVHSLHAKTSSIRPVVSLQYRLVTDRRTTNGRTHDGSIYRVYRVTHSVAR